MKDSNELISCPQLWGWELDYILSKLSDRLDICKLYGCFLISCDLKHILPTRSYQFTSCCKNGAIVMSKYLSKKFPDEAQLVPSALSSDYYSTSFNMVYKVICVDDINLSHVYTLLKIEDLLEFCAKPLNIRERSEIICCIVGELDILINYLESKMTENPLNSEKTTEDETYSFLKATLITLLDCIADSGRDRASFIKNTFSHYPTSSPDEIIRHSVADKHDLKSLNKSCAMQHTTELIDVSYSDLYLERLLHYGSLMSIWRRLKELWKINQFLSNDVEKAIEFLDNYLNINSVVTKIFSSIQRALLTMNWYRKIMFTRLLEVIADPLPKMSFSNDCNLLNTGQNSDNSNLLIKLVYQSFLISVGRSVWPYTSKEQLKIILNCCHISQFMKEQLEAVFIPSVSQAMMVREDFSDGFLNPFSVFRDYGNSSLVKFNSFYTDTLLDETKFQRAHKFMSFQYQNL